MWGKAQAISPVARYEIIRTHSGEVGVVYDKGLEPERGEAKRISIQHAADPWGCATDTAISILAHHFNIAPKRALAACFGTPQSTEEELMARLYGPFLEEYISVLYLALGPDGCVTIDADDIRNFAHDRLKTGTSK
jgi:hypothetical protein